MTRKLGATLLLLGWVLASCESGGGELAILDIEPRSGSIGGEQPVRITGANFRQDIGYTVYFGATRAPQITIMDDTTLLVATPPHDSGAVDVFVAADNGPAFRIVNGFSFTDQGGNVMEQVGEPGATQGRERF